MEADVKPLEFQFQGHFQHVYFAVVILKYFAVKKGRKNSWVEKFIFPGGGFRLYRMNLGKFDRGKKENNGMTSGFFFFFHIWSDSHLALKLLIENWIHTHQVGTP